MRVVDALQVRNNIALLEGHGVFEGSIAQPASGGVSCRGQRQWVRCKSAAPTRRAHVGFRRHENFANFLVAFLSSKMEWSPKAERKMIHILRKFENITVILCSFFIDCRRYRCKVIEDQFNVAGMRRCEDVGLAGNTSSSSSLRNVMSWGIGA